MSVLVCVYYSADERLKVGSCNRAYQTAGAERAVAVETKTKASVTSHEVLQGESRRGDLVGIRSTYDVIDIGCYVLSSLFYVTVYFVISCVSE